MRLLWVTEEADDAGLGEPSQWRLDAAARLTARGHRIHHLCWTAEGAGTATTPTADGRATAVPQSGVAEALAAALASSPDAIHVMTRAGTPQAALTALAGQPVLLDVWEPADAGEPGDGDDVAWASQLVARSAWVRDAVAARTQRPVERLECGVDTMRFRPDTPPPGDPALQAALSADGRPSVLWLGAPSEPRGVGRMLDLLVAMHARIPGVRLLVAARDPAQPRVHEVLLAEARELGLRDALCLLPPVAPADLPAVYAMADVAIAPTRAPEPAGLHIRQALASGLPVVAHASGGARELIVDRRHGRLIPPGDVPRFAHAVASLLLDPAWRAECSEHARLTAMERHDLEPSLYVLEDLYHRLRTDALRTRRPAA